MKLKKKIALAMAMIMMLNSNFIAEGEYAKAASRPKITKQVSVEIGKKAIVKLSKTGKINKITWKVSNKKIKLMKKNKKRAVIKGLKRGSASVIASYKLNGKNKKLVCKVIITKNKNETTTPVPQQTNQISVTPVQTPAPTAVATPVMNQAVPVFAGFKTYDDEILGTSEFRTMAIDNIVAFGGEDNGTNEGDEDSDKDTDENETPSDENYAPKIQNGNLNVNANCTILVKLTYENSKRDNIVEIVLNDSEYGKKQIYSPDSMKNKIISADTYYNEESDTYVTEVLLALPPSHTDDVRKIEVEETIFLRELTGVKGYVDMSKARTTSFYINKVEPNVESDSLYFVFEENSDDTYKLISVSNEMLTKYPVETLSIPSYYNGKPVTSIQSGAFSNAPIRRIVFSAKVEQCQDANMLSGAGAIEEIYVLGKSTGAGFNFMALNTTQLNSAKIVLDETNVMFYYDAYNDLLKRLDDFVPDDDPGLFIYGYSDIMYVKQGDEYIKVLDYVKLSEN